MPNLTANQTERNIMENNMFKDNNFFRKKKKYNGMKDKITGEKGTVFESDEENHYEPVRIGNTFSSNYIEYESGSDRNKTLSNKEYLDKNRPYLSNMINDLKTKGEWKLQLSKAVSFMSFKNTNEICAMHTKSDNI